MYKQYYRLQGNPFDLEPKQRAVFMSSTHREALAIMKYAVITRKGFLVLTGEVGTGKTTMLHALLKSLPKRLHLCMLNNPALTRDEFFYVLARCFNMHFNGNKAFFLEAFALFLRRCQQQGEGVLLIIDEAHVLPVDILEEIRLLSNQDTPEDNVLSIFLVGQPELNERMREQRLLPLRQRIRMRFHLLPFSAEETQRYILFRLRRAGANFLNIFSEEAIDLIHTVSQGTPRLINIICDYALLTGFADDKPVIDEAIIRECVQELHFPGEQTPLPLARTPLRWSSWHGKNVAAAFLLVLVAALVMAVASSLASSFVPLPVTKMVGEKWRQPIHYRVGTNGG